MRSIARLHAFRRALGLIVFCVSGARLGATSDAQRTWGPAGGGTATRIDEAAWERGVTPALPGTPLTLYKSFTLKGSYAFDAVGIRNRGFGTAVINLPASSIVKKAYLFWTIVAKAKQAEATFKQCKINDQAVTGTLLGSDYSPCWPRDGNNLCFSYRADVTTYISTETVSAYSLTGFASGLKNGKDPWAGKTPVQYPLAEGATLLVIYQNNSNKQTTIQLYNGNVTVKKNGEKSVLELSGFTAPNPLSAASLLFIGADGQDALEPLSEFNGHALKGSPLWDGISADNDGEDFDEGNLWDSERANVKPYLSSGATSAEVEVETGSDEGSWDCLVWVALVFSMTK